MTSQPWPPSEEQALATYLAEQVCLRASGRLDDECLRNYPRDVYFIGNLRPAPSADMDLGDPSTPAWLGELLNKLAPVAFGAEFLLKPASATAEVEVGLKWACYYRVFPSFSEQQEHQRSLHGEQGRVAGDAILPVVQVDIEDEAESTPGGEETSDAESTPQDRQSERKPRETLAIRFRKISCAATGIVRLVQGDDAGSWDADHRDLEENVAQELQRAATVASRDAERLRTAGSLDAQIRVPASAMRSEQSFAQFLASLSVDITPEWNWDIRTRVKGSANDSTDASCEIRFEFTNSTQMSDKSPNWEPFLFDPLASFRFRNCGVGPYELEQAPHGFRYDNSLWGKGFNCAVEQEDSELQGKVFRTNNAPIFEQLRYATRTRPMATISELAVAPLPVLDRIRTSMQEYLQEWDAWQDHYRQIVPDWESTYALEYAADRQRFASEIERFEAGLSLLRQDADALLAFQLTNEVFRRGPNESWRTFQVVFLVTQLPGILSLANPSAEILKEREQVDIIYFPTGGGKTEAYLGVTVFQCFFDRLRGKSAGVGVWARFPLRLLTVQQMQRFADVIGTAELVRVEQTEPRLSSPNVDGFAVGYFVGQGGSPNQLIEPRAGDPPSADWSKALDPSARQRWKAIMRCPSCKTTSVSVDFDEASVRLTHRCSNAGCRFAHGVIPVYVVDNEVYRYLPSVVVGTIDKLASLGNQRKFALILGEVDGKCREHGYFKRRCCQNNCRDQGLLQSTPPPGVSGPSIFVQDELHLLREGLGTFDSHYETFTQRLLQEFGQIIPLKVIASSATIEAFERQVEHLYGKDRDQARIFPAPGPSIGRSFYADTLEYPQRLYVGVIPHNKTIFNAILELLSYYQRAIQTLQSLRDGATNPYGGSLKPGSSDWLSLLDFYATSVTYFLAGRELNSIRTDLDAAVNSELQNENFRPAEILELTGSTLTDDVTNILERLQTPDSSGSVSDIVLATNMISHGVDIDRLNAMIFYGMPRQNAEYIQASSRVGRSHVGVIFTCLHPARERDQSHYGYFGKFHEFLGQLIEPVAINRWSKFSVQRTLPGLFMAVLLQLLANRSGNDHPSSYYYVDFVKREISRGNITAEHFIEMLQESYAGSSSDPATRDLFSDEIALLVRQFLDQIIAAGVHQQFVSDTLIPRPMTSLREVDELLDIELDDAGSRWAGRSR